MAADAFRAALLALSGSRASVQAAAAFFAAPGAAPACSSLLCAHAAELTGPESFTQRLRLLFVANEALSLGVAPALLDGLPALLRYAASVAPDAESREKLAALVRLWESRALVPADAVSALLQAAGGDQSSAAHGCDPPVPAGALPALVRRAGAGYSPLRRADVQLAARAGVTPAPAAREYYETRVAAFYEAASRSGTRGRPDADAAYEPPPAGRGAGTHAGVGGASDASAADAFRRAKSEAYYCALGANK